jgi:hypothetical protein
VTLLSLACDCCLQLQVWRYTAATGNNVPTGLWVPADVLDQQMIELDVSETHSLHDAAEGYRLLSASTHATATSACVRIRPVTVC